MFFLRANPLRWWDLAMVLLLVALGVFGVADVFDGAPFWAEALPLAQRLALAAAPLLAFVALYLALGRRALRRGLDDEMPDAASHTFLALLVIVVFVAVSTVPIFAVLQAIAYPMAWTIVARYGQAVAWNVAIAAATGAGLILALAPKDLASGFASAAITAPVSFVFAVIMGTWITRIAAQGERYRVLSEQLSASQAEVAALSAAAGAASERERLSRELHDTLTQTLAGLVMLSEQADRAFEAGDHARARERLGRVEEAARGAVVEARALVATTQPLGDGGLEAAIQRLTHRFATDTGIAVESSVDAVQLDREREVVLLRAAQEGLANARKHARASVVTVTLAPLEGGGAMIRVVDDGRGPSSPNPSASSEGFGLSGLADRVRAVGGEVLFGPGEQGGAVLEVRVVGEQSQPLSPAEALT